MATQNYILAAIAGADLELLAPHLQTVELPQRLHLEFARRPVEHVYFPDSGLISVVTHGGKDQHIEVGLIGFDGMSGLATLLGADRSPNSMHMQVGGYGRRISVDRLRGALEESATLQSFLLRFAQAFMVQASQTALANGRGTLETRLARWLLMAHDRLESPILPLTHEFLSIMLGVRRPGVTVALKKLEILDLVSTSRSVITVQDRTGLETIADGIYGVAEGEQERLTGWRRLHKA